MWFSKSLQLYDYDIMILACAFEFTKLFLKGKLAYFFDTVRPHNHFISLRV